MALVLGTNSGFVTTAPTDTPAQTVVPIDNYSRVTKDTSSATARKITEIGWWCNTATEESNFEVGLYAADGAVVPGEAGTRLYVDNTNAKGTDTGWKRVTVDWTISPNTIYYLAVQLDDTATTTYIVYTSSGGGGYDYLTSQTTLDSPYGGGTLSDANGMYAIYAVWEAAAGTNMQINIGDAWKAIPTMQINIGDAWKAVASAKINIGDAWKTIF